jgi:glutamate N-acetyltransferase/amino-acid N-acetyltransferase
MSRLPRGFRLATARAGIKEGQDRDDLALIHALRPVQAAGVFTTNRLQGAPVRLTRARLRAGLAQAVLINSGNANVCTPGGLKDAQEMAGLLARALGIRERLVLVCSTGVIGVPLPMPKLRAAIPRLAQNRATLRQAAQAIMTTDTFPKYLSMELQVGARRYRLSGFAKGAGMIQPRMATTLAFALTDAPLAAPVLKAALREAVQQSFNCITVDGQTSTSDTYLALASGTEAPFGPGSRGERLFKSALLELSQHLAAQVLKDGEGATKVLKITVKGARSRRDALRAAYAVANSMLVKTAFSGAEANWGRVMSALGASGAAVRPERLDLRIQGVLVARAGVATGRDKALRGRLSKAKEVAITMELGLGQHGAQVLSTDLTEEYVRLNAAYRT